MRIRFGLCAAIAALALSLACTVASASLAAPDVLAPMGMAHHGQDDAEDGLGPREALVAILIPLGSVGAFVTLVLAGFYASYRRDQTRHQTIRAIIERGGEVPNDLLQPPAPRRSDLRRGVLLVAAGAGLAVALRSMAPELWTAGIVPIMLGLGFLVVWKIERPAGAARRAGGDRIE